MARLFLFALTRLFTFGFSDEPGTLGGGGGEGSFTSKENRDRLRSQTAEDEAAKAADDADDRPGGDSSGSRVNGPWRRNAALARKPSEI